MDRASVTSVRALIGLERNISPIFRLISPQKAFVTPLLLKMIFLEIVKNVFCYELKRQLELLTCGEPVCLFSQGSYNNNFALKDSNTSESPAYNYFGTGANALGNHRS